MASTTAPVTGIDVIAGGAAVHVTVHDQAGNALPPADVAWAAVTGVTITADATGFLFSAAADLPAGSLTTTATYTGPLAAAPVASGPLTISVEIGVTGITFTSP